MGGPFVSPLWHFTDWKCFSKEFCPVDSLYLPLHVTSIVWPVVEIYHMMPHNVPHIHAFLACNSCYILLSIFARSVCSGNKVCTDVTTYVNSLGITNWTTVFHLHFLL